MRASSLSPVNGDGDDEDGGEEEGRALERRIARRRVANAIFYYYLQVRSEHDFGGAGKGEGDGPTAASMRFSDLCRVGCWEEEGVVCLDVRAGGIVGFGVWVRVWVVVGPEPRGKGVLFVLVVLWMRDCRVG